MKFAMRKYLTALILAGALITIYSFVDINLFRFDFPRRTNEVLFTVFGMNEFNEDIVILNTGKLDPQGVAAQIAWLLKGNAKIIGVNLCHFPANIMSAFNSIQSDSRVIFCNCTADNKGSSAIRVGVNNMVTHFKTDTSYFENRLSGKAYLLELRGNESERINYSRTLDSFFQAELEKVQETRLDSDADELIILIGYMGEYIDEEIVDFTNSRITPVNVNLGEKYLAPDMYDIQISANIISTIKNERFVDDLHALTRVLILFLLCLGNVLFVSLAQTRWLVVNILLYLIIFVVLLVSGSALIVYMFVNGTYIHLNELVVLLIITSISTVLMTSRERKKPEGLVDDNGRPSDGITF